MATATETNWRRVSRTRPCPVCQRADWCLFSGDPADPDAAICARVESGKRCGQAGYLHRLKDDPNWRIRPRTFAIRAAAQTPPTCNWRALANRYMLAVNPAALDRLAHELGVSVIRLERLGIGWADRWKCWTFPLRNASGEVVGINRRFADGEKRIIAGGHVGLYLPSDLVVEKSLLVSEGATDCAALLDLDFAAIGRFSCNTCEREIAELVRHHKPAEVIIVADADICGQRGAKNLAAVLAAYVPSVKIITPPTGIKDARAWKVAGATRADVEAAIAASPAHFLKIRTRINGR